MPQNNLPSIIKQNIKTYKQHPVDTRPLRLLNFVLFLFSYSYFFYSLCFYQYTVEPRQKYKFLFMETIYSRK